MRSLQIKNNFTVFHVNLMPWHVVLQLDVFFSVIGWLGDIFQSSGLTERSCLGPETQTSLAFVTFFLGQGP